MAPFDFYGDTYDDFYGDDFDLMSELEDQYMSDAQVAERMGMVFPGRLRERFSPDALLQLDPSLRGVVSDVVTQAEGDPYSVYSGLSDQAVQDTAQERFAPGWEQISEQVGLNPDTPEGVDQDNMQTYLNAVLENFFAASSPSIARNAGNVDWMSERFSGQPYQGGQLPSFQGPGFEGAGGMGAGGGAPAGGTGIGGGAGGAVRSGGSPEADQLPEGGQAAPAPGMPGMAVTQERFPDEPSIGPQGGGASQVAASALPPMLGPQTDRDEAMADRDRYMDELVQRLAIHDDDQRMQILGMLNYEEDRDEAVERLQELDANRPSTFQEREGRAYQDGPSQRRNQAERAEDLLRDTQRSGSASRRQQAPARGTARGNVNPSEDVRQAAMDAMQGLRNAFGGGR